jgi:hypothetical protein
LQGRREAAFAQAAIARAGHGATESGAKELILTNEISPCNGWNRVAEPNRRRPGLRAAHFENEFVTDFSSCAPFSFIPEAMEAEPQTIDQTWICLTPCHSGLSPVQVPRRRFAPRRLNNGKIETANNPWSHAMVSNSPWASKPNRAGRTRVLRFRIEPVPTGLILLAMRASVDEIAGTTAPYLGLFAAIA